MNVERWLQVTVAALAALGTLLLGIGQSNAWLPVVAVLVAASSVYVTDMTGKFRLNRTGAALAAVLAACAAAIQFVEQGPESQLLAIANLLTYLQVVLLYHAKDVRVYWQLLTLSLLQVVVAAALSFSLVFGLLLVLYLFVGLAALSLFFAYRRGVFYRPIERVGEPATAAPHPHRSTWLGFAPCCRDDLLRSPLARDLGRHVLGQGLITLLLSFVIFFLIPRYGKQTLLPSVLTASTSIGFSETVELGRLGEAFQDGSSVMRVHFKRADGVEPLVLDGEPVFRGAIVDTYARSSVSGRMGWSQTFFEEEPSGKPPPKPTELPSTDGRSRGPFMQEQIKLEPQSEYTVCSIFPAYKLDDYCPIDYDPWRQQLVRKSRRTRLDFTLSTDGIDASGHQVDITRSDHVMGPHERAIMTAPLKSGAQRRDPVKQFAAKALSDAKRPEADQLGRARALERALRDSPDFEYSLSPQARDPSLDPVEDFVSLHRSGHCEYFSSALTLLLRSQNIPARMVIGYKGGEFNSVGSYYLVRKLHAHTWVEAYLDPEHLPRDLRDRYRHGGWLRLDPTPASADDPQHRELTLAERTRDLLDFGDYLWTTYIIGLDSKRQQEIIYTPLSVAGETLRQIFSRKTWTETIPHAIASIFSVATWRWLRDHWFDWRFAAAAALLVLLAAIFVRWLRRLVPALRRLAARRSTARRRRRPAARESVAFYRQLERLLARHGIRRPESQTQHEFAMTVGGQFVESPRLSPAAWLPRRIVDAYYRVRFGRHALDKSEIDAVEQALRDLAAALASGPVQRAR